MGWFISNMAAAKTFWRLLISIAVLALPARLYACPVCGVGKEGARFAFIFTTGLLTFVPLIMIGSVCYYLWRRTQRADPHSSIPGV